ncbi:hypothetical protein JCM9279_005354 [Rhodotorula babjevae]
MQPASLAARLPPPPPTSNQQPPPRLALAPSVSPTTGFLLPSLYHFPPFFTRQPNPQTWAHQLDTWRTLALAHARFTRTFRLDLSDDQCRVEPFRNPTLNRQLALPTLRLVLDDLVAQGHAAWVEPPALPKSAVWVYWKRPDEWATAIYDWVKETGQTNSIMTFYELTEGGDLAHTTEFYRLPPPLLRKALDVLVKRGQAQVLKGLGEDGDGVKFV